MWVAPKREGMPGSVICDLTTLGGGYKEQVPVVAEWLEHMEAGNIVAMEPYSALMSSYIHGMAQQLGIDLQDPSVDNEEMDALEDACVMDHARTYMTHFMPHFEHVSPYRADADHFTNAYLDALARSGSLLFLTSLVQPDIEYNQIPKRVVAGRVLRYISRAGMSVGGASRAKGEHIQYAARKALRLFSARNN
jgi:hypothetical protein